MTQRLATPAAWPNVVLPRAGADLATLEDARAIGAFDALRTALRDHGPTATIALVSAAGLRGRGGAGFSAGEKWRTAAERPGTRVVVANGYGADPASSTDRTLMLTNPWAVIEGTAIAAFAVGAGEAIIAVRAEQADVVARLRAAIDEAERAGFLGSDIGGSGWSLDVRVQPVQGAFMLGEETVLLRALESRRGQPEQRPPHPAERGLHGRPTVVNNVQTLAAVPWIVREGAPAFAALGAASSPGTVLVQLRGPAGDGIAEVPTGTPLRALVDLAGGVPAGRTLKALLVGGPAGGILPPSLLDTPYEFEALRAVGAHIGSGSIVIADDRACILDLARVLTRFCADEACGKTIPCRIGLRRLSEIADRIASGRPRANDLGLLEDLAHDVAASALCDHERLATLPLGDGLRYFREELDAHLLRSSCPAGVCRPIAVPAGAAH